MRAINRPNCMLCQGKGKVLFSSLNDRLFGADGEWALFTCYKNECGLIWLSPQPVIEDIGDAYTHYYTHQSPVNQVSKLKFLFEWLVQGYVVQQFGAKKVSSYIQRQLSKLLYLFPGKRSVIDFKAAGLRVIEGGDLLEIGCGSGDSLSFLNAMGWVTTGIEIDPRSAIIAEARGLNILTSPLEKCEFHSSSFDAIVMNHVIEHLHHPLGQLLECLRILKVGGTMVIVTPNTKSMLYRLFGYSWMHLDPPRHLYLYNSQNLNRLAIDAGFHVKSIRTSIRDANSVYLASNSIKLTNFYQINKRNTILSLIKGYIFQLLEWLLIQFNKEAGEEIVMTLVKR